MPNADSHATQSEDTTMKTISVRTKIVVPTILLFILSLGASTWLTYRVSRDAMEQVAQEHVSQIADATTKIISIWIAERPREISAWSEQSALQAVVGTTSATPSA